MPRRISIRRQGEKAVVVIDSIAHTMTKPAFIQLMSEGLRVLQALEKTEEKGNDRTEA